MLLVLLVGSVVLQVWAWQRLRRRVVAGQLTRLGSSVRYGGWSLLPFLFFVGFFLGLIGLEELLGVALIPEPMGRTALAMSILLFGMAGVGWLCFSTYSALSSHAPDRKA